MELKQGCDEVFTTQKFYYMNIPLPACAIVFCPISLIYLWPPESELFVVIVHLPLGFR